MMSGRGGGLLVLAVMFALVAMGCPKPPAEPGEQLGVQGVTGPGRSTLADEQEGIPPGMRAGGPLEDVHFDFDSYELTQTAREILQKDASWLMEHAGGRVELEGHCDERGTVEYNLALGAKRAAAVKTYLVSLGVAPERVTTISYGEELPLCTEKTESCWQRNRRAHFVVMGE